MFVCFPEVEFIFGCFFFFVIVLYWTCQKTALSCQLSSTAYFSTRIQLFKRKKEKENWSRRSD